MPDRIGIMGGTFDPIHFGHLRSAEEAVDRLRLDRCLFIPTATPPHKSAGDILPYRHRMAMLRLAVRDNPRFDVSDLENRLPGVSYSVATLTELRRQWGDSVGLFFMVGLDAFFEMDSWWQHMELFRLADITVLYRPGCLDDGPGQFLIQRISPDYRWKEETRSFQHPALRPVWVLETTPLGISSTLIRDNLARGQSIQYLTPREVIHYIDDNRLYRP